MKTYSFMLVLACALFCACGRSTSSYETTTDSASTAVTDINSIENDLPGLATQTVTDTAGIPVQSPGIVLNSPAPAFDWDKKIIKIANAQVECKDYKAYNQQVHILARQHGGWIASESESQSQGRINNSMTIKVPVPQFDELMMAISNLDGHVIEKTINTEDVTTRIVDTKGRIAVRKEMRDKYLDLLHETKKIDDALKVQRELNDMHEDIEMASNQVQSMQVQAAYSTVNLNYYQLIDIVKDPVVDNTPGVGSRVLSAAANGGSWVVDLFIGLIGIWPILLGSALIIFFFRKRWPSSTSNIQKVE